MKVIDLIQLLQDFDENDEVKIVRLVINGEHINLSIGEEKPKTNVNGKTVLRVIK
mgnify:CR=1 FL=1